MEFLNRKLNYITENLRYLDKLYNEYNKSKDFEKLKNRLAISKLIEEITESAIKINNYLLNKKRKYSYTYKDTFLNLLKYYNLDNELFNELAETAKFRNEIVHEYSNFRTQSNISKNIERFIYLYSKYVLEIKKII